MRLECSEGGHEEAVAMLGHAVPLGSRFVQCSSEEVLEGEREAPLRLTGARVRDADEGIGHVDQQLHRGAGRLDGLGVGER